MKRISEKSKELLKRESMLSAQAQDEAGETQALELLEDAKQYIVAMCTERSNGAIANRAFLRTVGLEFRRGPGGIGFELWALGGGRMWSSTESAREYSDTMLSHLTRLVFQADASLEELYARQLEREAEAILALQEDMN